MSALQRLLALQEHDTALDQLRHRRSTLPERAAVAELEGRIASLQARRVEVAGRLDELVRRQTELEAETEASRRRAGEIERRMSSGSVTASRDLVAMQTEIDHLGQRQGELEEQTLEVMELREPVEGELAALDAELGELEARAGELRRALEEAEQSVDGEIAAASAERDEILPEVPPALLTEYERLRSRLGGVGVAPLVGSSCAGCHLALPATELARIKALPPDEVATCEQCGRILVRS